MTDAMMDAAVVLRPGELRLESIARPQPGPFEALVKIEVCGICSTTDRHIIEGRQCHHPAEWYPAVLGHESVGTVVAIGDRVTSYQPGDRVTRPAAIWPGETRDGLFSAWGGFAQYGIVRDRRALLAAGQHQYANDFTSLRQNIAPPGLDPLDAALAISLAEVASWVWKLRPLGGRSLVVGGTGFAAYAICTFARLAGAAPIIVLGRRPDRMSLARSFGADVALDLASEATPGAVKDLTGGCGAHYFAEATGTDAVLAQGLGTLRPGGEAVIYGAPEGYSYTLPLRAGPGDFAVRLVSAEDHLAYARVCGMLLDGLIRADRFRSHVWNGLDQVSHAIAEHVDGRVIKGFVRVDVAKAG